MENELDAARLEQVLTERGQHATGRRAVAHGRIAGMGLDDSDQRAPHRVHERRADGRARWPVDAGPGARRLDLLPGRAVEGTTRGWTLASLRRRHHLDPADTGDALAQAAADAQPAGDDVFNAAHGALPWHACV